MIDKNVFMNSLKGLLQMAVGTYDELQREREEAERLEREEGIQKISYAKKMKRSSVSARNIGRMLK